MPLWAGRVQGGYQTSKTERSSSDGGKKSKTYLKLVVTGHGDRQHKESKAEMNPMDPIGRIKQIRARNRSKQTSDSRDAQNHEHCAAAGQEPHDVPPSPEPQTRLGEPRLFTHLRLYRRNRIQHGNS